MSQANQPVTTHPTRRLLFLAAAGPAFVAALPATATPNADAELLALGVEFDAAWAVERAVFAAERGKFSHESDERTDAALDVTSALVERIEALPARTLAGLRLKARAVSWCFNGETISEPCLTSSFTAERLAYQVVRDMLAMT